VDEAAEIVAKVHRVEQRADVAAKECSAGWARMGAEHRARPSQAASEQFSEHRRDQAVAAAAVRIKFVQVSEEASASRESTFLFAKARDSQAQVEAARSEDLVRDLVAQPVARHWEQPPQQEADSLAGAGAARDDAARRAATAWTEG
jgi:hypothetical protein